MMTTGKQHHTSFKALVAANRAAGRLDEPAAPAEKSAAKKMLNTGMRLTLEEYMEAKQMAEDDDRSLISFCRLMHRRGVESLKAERAAKAEKH